MKKYLLPMLLCAIAPSISAQYTAKSPHSLSATTSFSDISLKWCAPTSEIDLCWHNGEAYNGLDGKASDPNGKTQITVAAKFSPDELKQYAGCTISAIKNYEYRNVYKQYIRIYEDGKLAYEQECDLSKYKKDSWRTNTLTTPYTIPEGKTIMFAVKYMYGYNQDLTAICDRAATYGKGNLFSYDDGKTWEQTSYGDFLITAIVSNQSTDKADSYNVYRDGVKINTEAIADTTYTVSANPDGKHTFNVSAVYGSQEVKSYGIDATATSISQVMPAPSSISATVTNGTEGTIAWTAPLTRSNEITWSNKTFGNNIGATSKSTPIVWIKQEFNANDLVAYPNHKITAINAYFKEATINTVYLFVIKNGVIDYYETVEDISGITADAWCKFQLTTPYTFEQGNTYAFGCCYKHTASSKPVAIDNSSAIESKGNCFSVSSISSKGFNQTKPTWKTLTSGKITGNFMLTADIEACGDVTPAENVVAYDVYRDGVKVASDVTGTSFSETVTDLGIKQYSVIAKSASGKQSAAVNTTATYAIPSNITAPQITTSKFDEETNTVSLAWTNESVKLDRYGSPTYIMGFDEEVDLLYGAKFTKDELKPYAGYKFSEIRFGVGAELDKFSIDIYADKERIYTYTVNKGDINAQSLYTLTMADEGITIPADKDIYIAYNATLPANTSAILLDGGPLKTNGAMISYNNGSTWMKLGTVSETYGDYNIVIGATIIPDDGNSATSQAESKPAQSGISSGKQVLLNSDGDIVPFEEYGIESPVAANNAETEGDSQTDPSIVAQRVYCNGDMISETTDKSYTETLGAYGIYNYSVSNVYSNGWESEPSEEFSVDYAAPQRPEAPYNFNGSASNGNLVLTWEETTAEQSTLKRHNGTVGTSIGMTSSNPEGYHAHLYTAAEIKAAGKVGEKITHIKFNLATTDVKTAAVFVRFNGSIIYEQSVAISKLAEGWNTVRLNKPVEIPEGIDIAYGYHLTYAKGTKPCTVDAGPAVSGYGDLISSSASDGYWYSLKTKYNLDYNFMIEAVCQKDGAVAAPAETDGEGPQDIPETFYTVYRDGERVKTFITEKTYTVENAPAGIYTVTYTGNDGTESAESNSVNYQPSGITEAQAEAGMYYDGQSQTVTLPAEASVKVYNANGAIIFSADKAKTVDLSGTENGIYIIEAAGDVLKISK